MMKPPRMIVEYRGPSDVVGGPGLYWHSTYQPGDATPGWRVPAVGEFVRKRDETYIVTRVTWTETDYFSAVARVDLAFPPEVVEFSC